MQVTGKPELTEADKQKAIDIAKADPGVQELLNKGASITGVSPKYTFGGPGINAENLEEEYTEEMSVGVEMTLRGTTWVAEVDLAKGKVVELREVTPGGTEPSGPSTREVTPGGTESSGPSEKSLHTESK